jgi:hypothetical protein
MALVAALAASCGGSSPSSTPRPEPCQTSEHVRCLNVSDDGATVVVPQGHEVIVVLSSTTLRWEEPVAESQVVLHQSGSPVRRAMSVQADFSAVGVGQTKLQATGTPICQPRQPCPQFARFWQVTVEVEP